MVQSRFGLQEWILTHQPKDDLLYKQAWSDQVCFVRDRIAGLMASTYAQYKDLIDVPSVHTSKSAVLPVYHLALPDHGLEFWFRDNFYNWNVSVKSAKTAFSQMDFLGIIDDAQYDYCFCEGMEQWKFGRFNENISQFTCCIQSQYDLYCFFRVIKAHFGIKPTD